MSSLVIRIADAHDREAIRRVEEAAFGQVGEATLVDQLVADGDVVIELVAERDSTVVGHILFSRLIVEGDDSRQFAAVALAPLAVAPEHQGQGIGSALVNAGHARLAETNEKLSFVLGDPNYYGRFGYNREAADGFESDYQCDVLWALAWGAAPTTGRLVYAPAFAAL